MSAKIVVTLLAGAALTENRAVAYNRTTGKVVPVTSGTNVDNIGVCEVEAASGQEVDVVIEGRAQILAGEELPPFCLIRIGDDAKAYRANAGEIASGYFAQPEVDISTGIPLAAASGTLVDVEWFARKTLLQSGAEFTIAGYYDFAEQGGAATDAILKALDGGNMSFPAGAIVSDVRYYVQTALTSGNASATVGLFVGSSAAPALTLRSAIALDNVAAPWGTGGKAGGYTGSASNLTSGGSGGNVVIKSSDALTAGKFRLYVKGYLL